MTKGIIVLFLLAMLGSCQAASTARLVEIPFEADSGSLAVRCGKLIDGLADQALDARLIVIRDGRIAAIEAAAAAAPRDLPLLDLGAYTCLPGLINTHTHLAGLAEDSADLSFYYRQTLDEATAQALESAAVTLLTGFTSVRNVGEYFPQSIYAARQEIDAGRAIGPRIRTAGPYLTIPGGGGDLVIPGHDPAEIPAAARTGVARGAEDFRNKAQLAIDGGADFLKVIASGAVFAFGGVPGAPEMTRDEIAAVVEVARANDRLVTAHVHSAQSARDAIQAGVDSIEHASLLDDDAIRLAAKHRVPLSMDVYNGSYTEAVGREQNYPEEFMRKNEETTEAQRLVFEKAYALGVPILYGTDAGVLPHDMGAWQFGIMVERGMRPMDAIRSATSVPAAHMRLAADIGAIEVGRFGDLIAVRGDPLGDVDLLKEVAVVVKGGLLFKLPESL